MTAPRCYYTVIRDTRVPTALPHLSHKAESSSPLFDDTHLSSIVTSYLLFFTIQFEVPSALCPCLGQPPVPQGFKGISLKPSGGGAKLCCQSLPIPPFQTLHSPRPPRLFSFSLLDSTQPLAASIVLVGIIQHTALPSSARLLSSSSVTGRSAEQTAP